MEVKDSVTDAGWTAFDTGSAQRGRYRDYHALMGTVRSIADATTEAQHQDDEEKMKKVLAEMANEETSFIVFDSAQT